MKQKFLSKMDERKDISTSLLGEALLETIRQAVWDAIRTMIAQNVVRQEEAKRKETRQNDDQR